MTVLSRGEFPTRQADVYESHRANVLEALEGGLGEEVRNIRKLLATPPYVSLRTSEEVSASIGARFPG